MKTVRPQYTPQKKVEKPYVEQVKEEIISPLDNFLKAEAEEKQGNEPLVDDTTTPVQYLMDSVIADKDRIINKEPVTMGNYVRFEITLTKRQYELWQKKGGEKWLKRALVGQNNRKK